MSLETRAPQSFLARRLTRRKTIILAGVSTASFALLHSGTVRAQDVLVSAGDSVQTFMGLSRFVTGHEHLDVTIGSALFLALQKKASDFPSRMQQLSDAVASRKYADVEALEEALQNGPLHATLLEIVRAWYAGIVEEGTAAKVYAFERALMYQPARDNIVIPTYAHNGPNYWVAAPNPVDVMPEF